MIKHTMQEWADFTGCYITKDQDGFTCMTKVKPVLEQTPYGWAWVVENSKIIIECNSDFLHSIIDYKSHDYKVLVEPHTEV